MSAIALEPLIAEAKERARRRRLLALAVLGLIGAALGFAAWTSRPDGGDSFTVRSPGQVARVRGSVDIASARGRREIDYVGNSGGVTWASAEGGRGIWLTTDGGRSWRAAGPRDAAAFSSNVHVDKRHGWIPGLDRIDRTTDGGLTWHHSSALACGGRCEGFALSFLDPRHGFAIEGAGSANRFFRTSDGGRTWQLVSRPAIWANEPITFVNSTDGFGALGSSPDFYSGPPLADLYRTTDGGRTWSKYKVAGSDSLVEFPIHRFGRRVVLVQNGPNPDGAIEENPGTVWVSDDAGAQWVGHPIPLPRVPPGLVASVTVVSPRLWFFAFGTELWKTADGGAHWRIVSVYGLPPHSAISQVSFSSSGVGWAVLPVAQYRQTLFRTTDGGRHWTPAGPLKPDRHKRG